MTDLGFSTRRLPHLVLPVWFRSRANFFQPQRSRIPSELLSSQRSCHSLPFVFYLAMSLVLPCQTNSSPPLIFLILLLSSRFLSRRPTILIRKAFQSAERKK